MNLASQGNFNQYFSAKFVMSRFWPTCKKGWPLLSKNYTVTYIIGQIKVERCLKILKQNLNCRHRFSRMNDVTLSGEDSLCEDENAADQSVVRGRKTHFDVRLKKQNSNMFQISSERRPVIQRIEMELWKSMLEEKD